MTTTTTQVTAPFVRGAGLTYTGTFTDLHGPVAFIHECEESCCSAFVECPWDNDRYEVWLESGARLVHVRAASIGLDQPLPARTYKRGDAAMTTIEHTQQADYAGVSGTFAVCSCGAMAPFGPDRYYVTAGEAHEGHVAEAGESR